MDEPDGVLGAAAIRVSQPTLMQQILTHESLGESSQKKVLKVLVRSCVISVYGKHNYEDFIVLLVFIFILFDCNSTFDFFVCLLDLKKEQKYTDFTEI